MGTAGRKARKRAGVKFERKPKTGTPLVERRWFNEAFMGQDGILRPRSLKKRLRALRDRGVVDVE